MAEGTDEVFPVLGPMAKPKFLPVNSVKSKTKSNESADDPSPPIFSKRRQHQTAKCTGDFMHLTVSKNWLVCVLSTPSNVMLQRFFLPRAATAPGEIPLEKYLVGYKISKLFLDHTGYHLLISLVPQSPGLSADFLYIHDNGPKVRRIEKFKDHEITAVAFNCYTGTESCTSSILLGTSRGLIFETELSQEADKPSYRKQVFDLGLGRTKYPITGLELLQIPKSNKYIVIATTPDCIYTFQEVLKPEEKSLQAIFASYVSGAKEHWVMKITSDWNYSVLRFFAPPNEKYPRQWGWLSAAGLHVGNVAADVNSASSAILLDESIISLGQQRNLTYEERRQKVPKSFILTEYHALLLYHDHITGICLLNQEVVYEEYFHEYGKLLNIVRDQFTGTIYVYTEKLVFYLVISNEERNIWEIYMNKGLYDKAEVHAAANPEHLDTVLKNKAEAAFTEKQYKIAADIYANTQMPFEEICLKFIDLDDKHPIINYVRKRLRVVSSSAEHVTMLVVWLTDLYLTQINFPGRDTEVRNQWQHEFNAFMQDAVVAKCIRENRVIIQNLITQHADAHNLSLFAIANEDFEQVINQQLSVENYKEALDTLRKQKSIALYYKYCPIIMEYLPHEVVDVLISQGRKLQIPEIMPTLIATESPKHVEEVIRYLEFAIYKMGETNQAVHNYLLRLYAEQTPDKVIGYLENEGHDDSLVHYDINYALIVCTEFGLNVACVFLQCLLQMWPTAVDLALTFDMSLAKETASKPRDEEMCRKLWLRIAYHDIKGTNDVEKALDLLKECGELLRIEDLLPFFSDFEKIDDFKKPICYALKEYNQKIRELEQDMEECTKQAERVRNDLQNVREHSVRIGAHETCTICESFLLVKPFFVFACGHKFHNDCLEKQIIPLLETERSRKLTMLKQQLDAALGQSNIPEQLHKQQIKREKVKQEIEEILASDCYCCGLMIETIDKPFVDDWDQVNVDWD